MVNENTSNTMTFEVSSPVDTEKLCKLIGIDISNVSDAYAIQYIKFVQIRKNKKKRINKNWAKKYGYKHLLANGKGWKIKNYTDGSYEFAK